MSAFLFFCLFLLQLYGLFRGHQWTRALTKLFNCLTEVGVVKNIVGYIHSLLDVFLDSVFVDSAFWGVPDSQLVKDQALVEIQKLHQEISDLQTAHTVWKEILQEDIQDRFEQFKVSQDAKIATELVAFKTEVGAHELTIGNFVSISDLKQLFFSEISDTLETQEISDQQERFLNVLLESLFTREVDSIVLECREGDKVAINSLVFKLLSPVFAAIVKARPSERHFGLPELSGSTVRALSKVLGSRKCEVALTDVVAAVVVADYLNMTAVGPKLRRALEGATDRIKTAYAVVHVNSSEWTEDQDLTSWRVPISVLTKDALVCLSDAAFAALLGRRQFYRKADLATLLQFKQLRENFLPAEFLAADELDASVLPDCEKLLSADAYASLLTAVLANIEKENARMLRLQSIKESPSEAEQPPGKVCDYHRTFDTPRFSHNQLWLVTVLAGVVNGAVRGAIRSGAFILFDWRIDAMAAVATSSLWLSFAVFLGIALCLILGASLLVAAEPLTAGTGTADVAATLNGIQVPRLFSFRTAVLKFCSTLLTSASGLLWVGPESSMSHLGGATNLLVAGVLKRMLPSRGTAELNDAERLDLIATGMAMGTAAAFRTTLAGIVYMAEGMAPLWRPAAFWRTLVGAGFAVYVAKLIDERFACRSPSSVMCVSPFGYVAFPLEQGTTVNLLTFVAIGCTAVFSGLCGGLFARACGSLGLHVAKWMPAEKRTRRVLTALTGMAVTTLLIMALVILTDCVPLSSDIDTGLSESSIFCESGSYNPAAVLLLSHHEYAVRYLYIDSVKLEYWLLIACWLLVQVVAVPFVFVALPVGFLTTHLLSGALVGKFFAQALGCGSPGIVAVCGSAASLAAYFRFPLTSSIFMIQMSSAARLSMPIIGAVIVATAVAYPISPSLMEIIMRIKRFPYLPRLHRSILEFLRGRTIADFMSRDVVVFQTIESRENVLQVLQTTQFSGFPVVTSIGRVLFVVSRDELLSRAAKASESISLDDCHANCIPVCVESNHEFLRCYRLFRHLGLRHMVVVDRFTKRIVGMVTRTDLVKAITAVPTPHYYYLTL